MIFCTFNFEIILYKEKFIKIKKFNKTITFHQMARILFNFISYKIKFSENFI